MPREFRLFNAQAVRRSGLGQFIAARLLATLLLATGFITLLAGSPPVAASPATCPLSAIRFASSSNNLYVSGSSTVCTPADLQSLRPAQVVKVAEGIYLLRANLRLEGGARLEVYGTEAGGTANELRLLSNNNSNAVTARVYIMADYGSVSINSAKVTSWNESARGPDTEYAKYGRAHIKVRSRVVNDVPNTSRMDILNSDVGYLGYYAAESYGLTWKVMDNAFTAVDVLGDVKNSRIHHNYFGIYTYGAFGMVIDNNQVDNNVKYGIDPHDDSDSLTISNNRTHNNGNHGIICSQRCDNIVISGNQSYSNVGHGIMLHRSVDNSQVINNVVRNNTDAGIALFESNNNLISGNTLEGNKNSLRLSVGASFNRFENNTVLSSTDKAIFTYRGSDAPMRPGNDGINRGNAWTGNILQKSKNFVLRLGATDQDRFENNDFRGNSRAKYDLSGATRTTFLGNQTDSGVVLKSR